MNMCVHERMYACMKGCMNESIHKFWACHAVGCTNLHSIDACFYTCKSVIAAACVEIVKAQQDMFYCPYLFLL